MPVKITARDVLLVIDVQNDFCPGGALAVTDGNAVIPVINRLGEIFPHVIVTQDWHPAGHVSFASSHPGKTWGEVISWNAGEQVLWPDHCVQATEGATLHKDLFLPRTELILRKGWNAKIDSYSAFQENDRKTKTGLAGYLEERDIHRVFVAGLAFDFCVRFSAVDAYGAGFDSYVIEDACRGIDWKGSVAATKREFAKVGVQLIQSSEIER